MKFRCCAKNSLEAKDILNVYEFLRAIADPNRLKILCFLREGPRCVCEIVLAVGISNKLASHHLKQLKNIEILTEKRKGNFIYYKINKKVFREYKIKFNQIIK